MTQNPLARWCKDKLQDPGLVEHAGIPSPWEERKHPREQHGRFSSTNQGRGGSHASEPVGGTQDPGVHVRQPVAPPQAGTGTHPQYSTGPDFDYDVRLKKTGVSKLELGSLSEMKRLISEKGWSSLFTPEMAGIVKKAFADPVFKKYGAREVMGFNGFAPAPSDIGNNVVALFHPLTHVIAFTEIGKSVILEALEGGKSVTATTMGNACSLLHEMLHATSSKNMFGDIAQKSFRALIRGGHPTADNDIAVEEAITEGIASLHQAEFMDSVGFDWRNDEEIRRRIELPLVSPTWTSVKRDSSGEHVMDEGIVNHKPAKGMAFVGFSRTDGKPTTYLAFISNLANIVSLGAGFDHTSDTNEVNATLNKTMIAMKKAVTLSERENILATPIADKFFPNWRNLENGDEFIRGLSRGLAIIVGDVSKSNSNPVLPRQAVIRFIKEIGDGYAKAKRVNLGPWPVGYDTKYRIEEEGDLPVVPRPEPVAPPPPPPRTRPTAGPVRPPQPKPVSPPPYRRRGPAPLEELPWSHRRNEPNTRMG